MIRMMVGAPAWVWIKYPFISIHAGVGNIVIAKRCLRPYHKRHVDKTRLCVGWSNHPAKQLSQNKTKLIDN